MGSFNSDLFFGILIGLIAYVLLYIGKGIQKYAIEAFKVDKTIKSKHSGVWIFGTVLTALFVFIQWIPLTVFHTPTYLIAPLEGVGLVSLLIFSFIVLKEKITKLELIGVTLIITGTILINLVVTNPVELLLTDFQLSPFLIALGILFLPTIVFCIIAYRKPSKFKGVILGFTAGSFMAFQTLSKRISDINELALIFTFVMFAFATITLVLTQYAFTMAKANVVVPSFSSASIIVTIILGTLVINESIKPIQIAGLCCIVFGIIVMNLLQGEKKKQESEYHNISLPITE
ncbi:MAG: hypothetical protein ACTSPF_00665 [Candidatus Heimdallarchaeaceae archaeon]